MSLFTSQREKRLWLYALIVLIAIIATLVFAGGITSLIVNQNMQVVVFWMAFILIGLSTLIHGLKTKPSKMEIVVWFGIFAVYLLFFLRLGHAERTHLMEYSILAIFILVGVIGVGSMRSADKLASWQAFGVEWRGEGKREGGSGGLDMERWSARVGWR